MDLGTFGVLLEGARDGFRALSTGVVVVRVPWARHDTRHGFAFDDMTAWLASRTTKSTSKVAGVSWCVAGRADVIVLGQ